MFTRHLLRPNPPFDLKKKDVRKSGPSKCDLQGAHEPVTWFGATKPSASHYAAGV